MAQINDVSQHIRLNGAEIAYRLKRGRRTSFVLRVDDRGVSIAAPLAAPQQAIETFALQHAKWILEKLALQQQQTAARHLTVADGASFPVLGKSCRLHLESSARTTRWQTAANGEEELILRHRGDLIAGIERALKQRALKWFHGRVEEHCYRLGLAAPAVRLSSARTRWGSCSQRSGIRLHWQLIHLAPHLIDYVVAHEVAHLLEMNHSPRFWGTVERICPDWRRSRLLLRSAKNELPLLVLSDQAK